MLLLGAGAHMHAKLMAPLAAVYGLAVVACGINPIFGLLPPLLFVAGFGMTTSNISANAQIQTLAAPELRGQAVSLYMLAIRGGSSDAAEGVTSFLDKRGPVYPMRVSTGMPDAFGAAQEPPFR